MPFVMPLLMPPKKHIVSISLLNALESDQVCEELLLENERDDLNMTSDRSIAVHV